MPKFQKIMLIWLIIGLAFWLFYMFVDFQHQFIYFYIWVIGFGLPVYLFRKQLAAFLQLIPLPTGLKFILLGYAAVLLEEIFAALANHLSEGFEISLYLQRILQFWALNILAFTGFIFGWYFLTKWFQYSNTEIFFLAGLWGLYGEKIIFTIFANPAAFFFMTPVMIFTYGLVITPAMLSLKTRSNRRINPILKFILTYVVIFAFTIIPIMILFLLRTAYPGMFPPPNFIPF